MSARRARPESTDALLKKCSDQLLAFSENKVVPDNAQLWQVWEMFRVLTLRIRDFEANAAAARRPDPELIKALAKLPPPLGGRS